MADVIDRAAAAAAEVAAATARHLCTQPRDPCGTVLLALRTHRHIAAERAGRTEEAGRRPGRQQRHLKRLQLIGIGFLGRAQHQAHLSVSKSFHTSAQTASTSTRTSILAARLL